MKCKICQSENNKIFSGKILNKYEVDYFLCNTCGFIQTQEPYWLEEAYSRPINLSDTGYVQRNIYYSKLLTTLLFILDKGKGQYLDYAGGYGVFVRLMRDIGFNFFWDDKYTKNLFASGFEWNIDVKINAITLFEVFEHLVDPIKEIKNLLKLSDTLIYSTETYPFPVPKPEDWWYYGLDHGQHISIYSEKTFKYISLKYDLNYYRFNTLHILSKRNFSKIIFLALKLNKFGIYKLIQKRMKSKTLDDYNLMKAKISL